MLCGRAGGMCEFEGCNKRLFYDNVTLAEFNNSFVAHIIASSENGPRGDAKLSPEMSDKIENLMLMCADHHKLIDNNETGPRDYPVSKLRKMKKDHEEKMDKICELFNTPETEIVLFSSPIKGKDEVDIDYKKAVQAVVPTKRPASNYGTCLRTSSPFEYRTSQYWEDCCTSLEIQCQRSILTPYKNKYLSRFSIFSIAPIPLIIKLGEIIGDKIPCDIYQKTREPDTWKWQSKELTNSFDIKRECNNNKNNKVALIVALTSDISIDRINEVGEFEETYKISAINKGVDCIKSLPDLSAFWHLYQKVCDEILDRNGRNCEIQLFPAVPVSVAFEIGRRYMKKVYPRIKVFDECNGFFETIVIGG